MPGQEQIIQELLRKQVIHSASACILVVDRGTRTQSTDNAVLWRRLELLGRHEWLRCLRPSTGSPLLTIVGSGVSQPVGS